MLPAYCILEAAGRCTRLTAYNRVIEVIASRDEQCDQTLEMFEKDAPGGQVIIASNGQEVKVDPIVFLDAWVQHLPKSHLLKCYEVNSGEPIKTDKP
jgi:hypothetical protein